MWIGVRLWRGLPGAGAGAGMVAGSIVVGETCEQRGELAALRGGQQCVNLGDGECVAWGHEDVTVSQPSNATSEAPQVRASLECVACAVRMSVTARI